METFAPKGKVFGPILPQFVLEKPLTFGAKVMYALLCNYCSEKDHCWPSQATLAARLSCSVGSVKNYLTELVKAKLIEVRREQYRSSIYYMILPGELKGKETKVVCQQPASACPEPKSGYINTLSKQSKEENPPLPPTEPETPKVSPALEAPAAGGVREEKSRPAPLPHCLSSLQKEASGKCSMTAKQVLDTAQSLYEKKLTTYPRTDCRYLPEEQFDDAGRILPCFCGWFC